MSSAHQTPTPACGLRVNADAASDGRRLCGQDKYETFSLPLSLELSDFLTLSSARDQTWGLL